MSETGSKLEKTQKGINDQIRRIGEKLGRRALDMGDAINTTNTPENEITAGSGYLPHVKKDKDVGARAHTSVNGQYPLKKIVAQDGDTTSLFVGNVAGANIKRNQDMPVRLTNEQTIHASAGALSQVRDELAQKNLEHKAQVGADIQKILKV